MESKMFRISAKSNDKIQLKIYPGHFATPQSHITHYLDLTTMKYRCAEAKTIAQELAKAYSFTTSVDTIVCLDGLEVVGAYLSDELTRAGVLNMNSHQTMYIVKPEYSLGQAIFRDNMQFMIKDKNVLILNGSITTGETLSKVAKAINYYGGVVTGIAAIFSAVDKVAQLPVISLFKQKEIPNYSSYSVNECPLCQRQERLDAIVNGYGYSKI